MSLVHYLNSNANLKGDQIGWVVDERAYTYREMNALTNRFANALMALGLEKGDRVSLYLPNCLEYLISCYGVAKTGGVINPLNTMFKKSEIKYIVNDATSKIIITTPDLYANVAEVKDDLPYLKNIILTGEQFDNFIQNASESSPGVDIQPQDSMYLAYSSGTTGNPKGVVHTHFSTAAQAIGTANRLGFSHNDKIVTALPLFHLYGGNIILGGAIVAGSCLIVHNRFDAERILSSVEKYKANIIAGVPTMFAYLKDLPINVIGNRKHMSLDFCVSAGSILSSKNYSEFKDIYGIRILDCYGITEAAGNLTGNYRYGAEVIGSAGIPYPFTDIKIVDDNDNSLDVGEVGELIAKAPQIMKEYWNLPKETEETLKGGYLHTGDLAKKDERGYIYIVDRKKDLIITGGFNIYPAEVENVINTYEKVAQSAMFSISDEAKGEIGCAAIILKPGTAASEEEIISYCRTQMATYKCPRKVIFVDSLPMNAMNKILRRELRKTYSKG